MYKKVGANVKSLGEFMRVRSARLVVPIFWIKSEDEFKFQPTTTQKTKWIVVILILGYKASCQNTWYANENRGKNYYDTKSILVVSSREKNKLVCKNSNVLLILLYPLAEYYVQEGWVQM